MQLLYYLASWGRLRGSTYLFKNTNSRHYLGALEVIAENNREIRSVTPDQYCDADVQKLLVEVCSKLGDALLPEKGVRLTLVTKTMMGVWDVVSSFDTHFKTTFTGLAETRAERGAMRPFGTDTIEILGSFYAEHRQKIDALAVEHTTVDFATGTPTDLIIPAAEVIDIFGFGQAYYGLGQSVS